MRRRWSKGFGEDDHKPNTVHDMSTVQAEVKLKDKHILMKENLNFQIIT